MDNINNDSLECDSDCPGDVFVSTIPTETEIEHILEQSSNNRKYNTSGIQLIGNTYLMVVMLLWLSEPWKGQYMVDNFAECSIARMSKKNGMISTSLLQEPQIWNNADMFVYAVPLQTNSPVIRIRYRQEQLASNSSATYTGQPSSSQEEHPSMGNTTETEGPSTAVNLPHTRGRSMTSRGHRPDHTVGPPTAASGNLPNTRGRSMTLRRQTLVTEGQSVTSRGHRPEALGLPTAASRNLPNTVERSVIFRRQSSVMNRQSASLRYQQLAMKGHSSARRRESTITRDLSSNVRGHIASQNVPTQQVYPHVMRYIIEKFDGTPVIRVVLNTDFMNNYHRYGTIYVISEMTRQPAAREQQQPFVRGGQSHWRGNTSAVNEHQSANRQFITEQPFDMRDSLFYDIRRQRSDGRRQPSSIGVQRPDQPPCTDISTNGRHPDSFIQHPHDMPRQQFDSGRGETMYPYIMYYRIEVTGGTEVIRVMYTTHFIHNVQRYRIICVSQLPESLEKGSETSKED